MIAQVEYFKETEHRNGRAGYKKGKKKTPCFDKTKYILFALFAICVIIHLLTHVPSCTSRSFNCTNPQDDSP